MAVDFDLVLDLVPPDIVGDIRFVFGSGLPIAPYSFTSQSVGTPGVTLVAQGIFAESFRNQNVAVQALVSFEPSLVPLYFDLTVPLVVVPPSNEGYRFYFGNGKSIAPYSFTNQSVVEPVVSLVAQGIFAETFRSQNVTVPAIVFRDYDNHYIDDTKGMPIDFDMRVSVPVYGPSIDFVFATGARYITPGSIRSQSVSAPDIKNFLSYLLPASIHSQSVATPAIRNSSQVLRPTAFRSQSVKGAVAVDNQWLYIYQVSIHSQKVATGTLIELGNRYLRPASIHAQKVATGTTVERLDRVLTPPSFQGQRVSTNTTVEYRNRQIFIPSFKSQHVSVGTTIELGNRLLRVNSFRSQSVRGGSIELKTRRVFPQSFRGHVGVNSSVSYSGSDLDSINFMMMLF